jgi:hypothetical protein
MSSFFCFLQYIICAASDNKMMDDEIKYSLVPTREEHPSLTVHINGTEQALHSKMFPSKEADTMRQELEPGSADMCIVLGVGLGYHLIPLKEYAQQYKSIILIDVLPQAKELIASAKICSFLSAEENIIILAGISPAEIRESLSPLIDFERNNSLTLEPGAVITGNANTTAGGVRIVGGSLTMNGGAISGTTGSGA